MEKPKAVNGNNEFNPLLFGLICGFYPLAFYYSNNFWAIDSWEHLAFFTLIFLGIPIVGFSLFFLLSKFFPLLSRYKSQILFVLIIMATATLMSQAIYLKLEKKMLLALLIVAVLLSWKLHSHYRKLLVIILLMSVIPVFKCLANMVEYGLQDQWRQLPDAINEARFKEKPNIYMIQPDGYAGQEVMKNEPYAFDSPFYTWLEENGYKVYGGFHSNYPASLASNSSMFAMRQHRFGKTLFPSIDVPNARDVIAGNNNAIEILRRNGYSNFFIVQDEYFQQNRPQPHYDYYNIDPAEIPYFSNDNNVKKIVFDDLKAAMDTSSIEGPRFYFVEKLLPHHIHFSASKAEERDTYVDKIKEVNQWLKKTLTYIEEKDPHAIVIVLADHGGWVGLGSYSEMFSTTDPVQIRTVYSSLAAIKWNGYLQGGMDKELRSNVNVFRVLFSVLSQNGAYLKHLEDNSSYNLKQGSFGKTVRAVINDRGEVVIEK